MPLESSAFTPGERIAMPVKLPVGSGIASSCCFIQDVAVGRIDGVEQRRFFDRDGLCHLADFQRCVHGRGAVRLITIEGIFWV